MLDSKLTHYMLYLTFFISSLIINYSFAATPILLDQKSWKNIHYNGVKANRVSFEDGKIMIQVDNSAGPIIYPLSKAAKINFVHLDIQIKGQLKLKDSVQGSSKNDDFKFRLGLVVKGEKTLSTVQKFLAPSWIKSLFNLAQDHKGIDYVHFLSTWQDERLAMKSRVHPLSEYLKEHYVIKLDENQKFLGKIPISSKNEIIALWIACDGDDTQSSFQVIINKILLE